MSEPRASYKKFGVSIGALVLGAAVLILGGFLWGLCVTTIKPGHVGIVFHERGKTDPAGHFIVEEGYKGTLREPLLPGLKFFWQTKTFIKIEQVPMTVIPEGKVGVLVAQDGRELREGAVLAEDDEINAETGELIKMGEKGIRKTILKPGTYPINTKYFTVELYDAVNVEPGKWGYSPDGSATRHPLERFWSQQTAIIAAFSKKSLNRESAICIPKSTVGRSLTP